ncbi:TRAP transporter large permease [Salinibacterium hongtaonis]|uniref:TRAP transporter large permease n=1 Tax=Homoserinimonas hongtaonis TaxID=2079791 RepID=A0A2U1T140_9MICO|nr:TRAP transporter large permease [Salinibacterium hongtaonis]PWB97595.1 TRAP transporter large permease [Salinibacterium hongtaonis]
MELPVLIASMFVLLALRVPIAFAILGPSMLYLSLNGFAPDLSFRLAIEGIESWPLLAVPLFVLVGAAANHSGIAERLFDLVLDMMGKVRGALGYVNVTASLGFSWMSGASLADVAGLGSVEVKQMQKRGYSDMFSAGVTTASSLIGPIMPPSIPAIVYASIAGVSTGAMFLAGIVPALVMFLILCLTVFLFTFRRPDLAGEPFNAKRLWRSAKRAVLPMIVPVIIIGGILTGAFTPTEAACVAAIFILVVSLFIVEGSKRSFFYKVFRDTVLTTASIMIILGASNILGWILSRERVPFFMAQWIGGLTDSPVVFLLLSALLLLIIGCFMESLSALVITVPVLLPIAIQFGVDPVHFGLVAILSLMIGLLTPPFGAAVFVISGATGIPIWTAFKGSLMFVPSLLIMLLLLIFVPELALFLVN